MPRRASLCGLRAGDWRAVERPLSGVRLVEAGQQVEERRLAGAVRPDQGGDLVALDLDVVDVDGDEPAERSAHRVDDEDRIGLGDAGLALRRPLGRRQAARQRTSNTCSRRSPKMPCGRNTTRAASTTPATMNLTWLKLSVATNQSGSLSWRVAWLSRLSTNWIDEEEDHRADDRPLHPAETADDDDREAEERQVGGELAGCRRLGLGGEHQPADRADQARRGSGSAS